MAYPKVILILSTHGFLSKGLIVSRRFDPYHRWLGIPPKDQPANHYRLLGIDLFESDVEVIRDAAERQIAHVRSYQLGDYVEHSQRILNELAAAKGCLVDPHKKATYDASLKNRAPPLAKAPAEVVSPAAASEIAPPIRPAKPPGLAPPSQPREPFYDLGLASRSRRRPRRSWQALLPAAGVGAALVLVIGWAAFFQGQQDPTAPPRAEQLSSPAGQQRPADLGKDDSRPPDTRPARAPRLGHVPDQTVVAGSEIRFAVTVSDRGSADKPLRFALAAGVPPGATIDPRTGVFAWTPTGGHPPRTYPVTVQVFADGPGDLSDQTTFRVMVERLATPIISPIAPRTVAAGSKICFKVGITGAGEGIRSPSPCRKLLAGCPSIPPPA